MTDGGHVLLVRWWHIADLRGERHAEADNRSCSRGMGRRLKLECSIDRAPGSRVQRPHSPNLLRGVAGDAAYIASFLAQRTTGPVVLVGHSYGGVVITNAGTAGGDVKAL